MITTGVVRAHFEGALDSWKWLQIWWYGTHTMVIFDVEPRKTPYHGIFWGLKLPFSTVEHSIRIMLWMEKDTVNCRLLHVTTLLQAARPRAAALPQVFLLFWCFCFVVFVFVIINIIVDRPRSCSRCRAWAEGTRDRPVRSHSRGESDELSILLLLIFL